MKIDVFDTYVTQENGVQMHFDVFLPQGNTQLKAEQCAVKWLESIGIQTVSIHLDKCQFCHIETANPEIEQAISTRGYAILQMEGCPSPT